MVGAAFLCTWLYSKLLCRNLGRMCFTILKGQQGIAVSRLRVELQYIGQA
jgi:hypothetical protein